ncbi:MAG: DUF2283 domain-containing protein [Thaumarchaeota archaeon]|nr:DUF2283 domain-containing protein [Nitrososphaerota archaeon]
MDSVTYDEDAKALYIRIGTKKAVRTLPLGNDKFLDIDSTGKVVGIEVLTNSKITTPEFDEVVRRTEEIKLAA